jgi:hypothetical protein
LLTAQHILDPVLSRSQTTERIMNTLTGEVAIVTGASKGIGAGIALRLAKDGAAVVAMRYYTTRPTGCPGQQRRPVPSQASSRTSSRVSSARTVCGSAEGYTPSSSEARVKLPWCATRRNTAIAGSRSGGIVEE